MKTFTDKKITKIYAFKMPLFWIASYKLSGLIRLEHFIRKSIFYIPDAKQV